MEPRKIMIKDEKLVVKNLEKEDLVQVWSMSKKQGWTSSLDDINRMFEIQPEAFIGIFSVDGILVGHIAVFLLDDETAYIGIVIVSEVMRGYGVGRILMEEMGSRIGSRNAFLDSTPNARNFYRKMGFRSSPIHTFSCTGKAKIIENFEIPPNVVIKDINNNDIDRIFEYDSKICKFVRHEHLRKWMEPSPSCFSFAAFQIQDGRCVGYICARRLDEIYKIQPLYADSEEIATSLFQYLVKTSPVEDVAIFRLYPTVQSKLHALVFSHKNGLNEVGEVTDYRMFKGKDQDFDWTCVYSTSNTTSTII